MKSSAFLAAGTMLSPLLLLAPVPAGAIESASVQSAQVQRQETPEERRRREQQKPRPAQPQRPSAQPQRPPAQPQRPAAQPQKPVQQPQRPAARPPAQPQRPAAKPPTQPQRPAAQPQAPAGQPQRPAAQPQRPAAQPQRPAQQPSAQPQRPAATQQPPAQGQPQRQPGQPVGRPAGRPAQQPAQGGQPQQPGAQGQPQRPAAGQPPAARPGQPPAQGQPPAAARGSGAPPPSVRGPVPIPGTPPVQGAPGEPQQATPGQPQQAARDPRAPRRLDDVRERRREERRGDRTVIREPGRTIIREGDRTIIRHNESDRFRYVGRPVRTDRRGNQVTTVYERPDGVRIVTVVDNDGRLIRRSRRWRDGREVIIIDNRPRGPRARAGFYVDLRPPVVRIPREQYIVEAEDAPPDVVYQTFVAPPVEPVERAYTLDEVRYNYAVRARMRRVDIDTITFDSGSWELSPDQVQRLAAIAEALNRAIADNPSEVFLIEGHTDAVGDENDNLSLSDRRAEAVALALTEQFQVPPENLVTQGYGEQHLKVQTDADERRNRRVTILRITPLMAGGGSAQRQN